VWFTLYVSLIKLNCVLMHPLRGYLGVCVGIISVINVVECFQLNHLRYQAIPQTTVARCTGPGSNFRTFPLRERLRMTSSDDSKSDTDALADSWMKTGFVDGSCILWYNSISKKMEWRKMDFLEDRERFNVRSFVVEYGFAYFMTALTLSAISFGTCYLIVSKSGVDITSLLVSVGVTGKVQEFAAHSIENHHSKHAFKSSSGNTPITSNFLMIGVSQSSGAFQNLRCFLPLCLIGCCLC
jgi:hypothetical protein